MSWGGVCGQCQGKGGVLAFPCVFSFSDWLNDLPLMMGI